MIIDKISSVLKNVLLYFTIVKLIFKKLIKDKVKSCPYCCKLWLVEWNVLSEKDILSNDCHMFISTSLETTR